MHSFQLAFLPFVSNGKFMYSLSLSRAPICLNGGWTPRATPPSKCTHSLFFEAFKRLLFPIYIYIKNLYINVCLCEGAKLIAHDSHILSLSFKIEIWVNPFENPSTKKILPPFDSFAWIFYPLSLSMKKNLHAIYFQQQQKKNLPTNGWMDEAWAAQLKGARETES